MKTPRVTVSETATTLPAGYSYGAHYAPASRAWSGYYVIRASDGASCIVRVSPEADEVTAAALDAEIERQADA